MAQSIQIIVFIFFACQGVNAQSTDTLRYTLVRPGNTVKGGKLFWKIGKNDYYFHTAYNDQGRGPSITEHVTVDNGGKIIAKEITGLNYFKASVNETFSVNNGKTYWKNGIENDSAEYHGQLYSAIYDDYGERSLDLAMIRLSGKLNLFALPTGTLSFRELQRTTVQGDSQIKNLVLIEFSGYGNRPDYIWFDEQGDFFATLSESFSWVREGFEKNISNLLILQRSWEDRFFRELATSITKKDSGGIGIRHVTVFDSETGTTSNDQTLLIHNGRIKEVGNSSLVIIPKSYQVIEGENRFLMPGLWEMHGHFRKSDGAFMLAQGVTNFRDMGNGPSLLGLREDIDQDSLLGPDISYISGFIDKVGEMSNHTGVLVHSQNEALDAIIQYKKKGYDQIKIYSSIEPSWVKPMAEKAHSLGMRVCGHVPAFMTASQAVDAGFDEVTHMNMLMLNFFGDTVDTRNITRLTLIGRKGYQIDVEGPEVQQFIQQLKNKKIVIDPTMSVFERIYLNLPGKISKAYAPISDYLPSNVKRAQMSGSFIGSDSLESRFAASFDNMKKMLKKLYDAGLIIVAGTDGGILQHELEIYSESGIPNADVLKMATFWAAQDAGKLESLGTIKEGKIANLILVDGNPLLHMNDIRKIFLTIKGDKMYSPKAIYNAFGWGYYY
jgi:hypothetical protein